MSKITNFLSHWLEVTTYRNNSFETILFNEGEFSSRKTGSCQGETGTFIQWKPSEEFFSKTEVDIKVIKELFETITCLCPGLTIILDNNGSITNYHSENGLLDYVDNHIDNKEILDNRFIMNYKNGKNKLDLVMTYTSNYSSTIVPYVNTGLTETGPHITSFKTAITREFNKFFREKGWLKDKDENLSGEDIQEGMYVIFNITTTGVKYDAQVKSRVVGIEIKDLIQEFTTSLSQWLSINEKEVKGIVDKALRARAAREAAKKAREAIRNAESKGKTKLKNMPTKLVDAWSKSREKCELLIAEGDSAACGLIAARDGEIHGVFPIRGKIISCYKNNLEKILSNQEVVNIIKALGLEIDKKTNKLIYDKDKLRYGKVLLCADADPDGENIRSLLLTFFWFFCPELVEKGHIWVAIPPLFRVTAKGNKYIYLKDATALEEYKNLHNGEKYLVNRMKGLGEMDPDELSECLLEAKTRNAVQITVQDVKETNNLFDILMGPNPSLRRDYIAKHAEEANYE